MENTIAVVRDPLFLEHRPAVDRGPSGRGYGHPEAPERLGAADRALAEATLGSPVSGLAPRDASHDELARVHTEGYLAALGRIAGRQGYLDADTYYAPGSYAAACRAAGGAVAMVEELLSGRAHLGVALVRPPGHHARPHTAMGFCLLNNAAVAAAHARALGAARVAIVDWDVHHGNGTQEIFYEDPSVLYVSLHQFPFYPGTGGADEMGDGEGTGTTVNVPLSAGADDGVYLAAFDRIVTPVLAEFDPDLVLVSAGFDAHARDPLAAMRLTEEGYAGMARRLARAIPRGASGRIGLLLEGGYDLDALRGSLRSTLEAFDETEASPCVPGAFVEPEGRHGDELSRALRAARRHFRLA